MVKRRNERMVRIAKVRNENHYGPPERTVKHYTKVVCEYLNVPEEKLSDETRKREIVQARQIAMYFAKRDLKKKVQDIGEMIGGKCHSTVSHANKTVSGLIEVDPHFRHQIEEIDKLLK